MSVDIHGKKYITVAERLLEAKDAIKSINTEVLFSEPVVIKATVVTNKGTFTGISAANPTKMIEKNSPYEVAETSAVGRALAFAGFAIEEGIASAEEIQKSEHQERPYYSIEKQEVVDRKEIPLTQDDPIDQAIINDPSICSIHSVAMKKYEKNDSSWYSHKEGDNWCSGKAR